MGYLTVSMTNEDGTPFYANLSAPLSTTITLGEAYSLTAQLRDSARVIDETVEKVKDDQPYTADLDLLDTMSERASELRARAAAIETVIDGDKYAQWAATQPAHAFRVTGRSK